MVDDAHGLGVLGAQGQGVVEHYHLSQEDVPVLIGTLGKSFGTAGAFVAGSESLIETVIQKARSYIYTTALPPALAAATLVSLQLLVNDDWRRERLQDRIQQFRSGARQLGLPLTDSTTAIQPVLVGDSHQAMRLSDALLAENIWVSAIRPPTVPLGGARLRITFSALHEAHHVDRLLCVLDKAWGQLS
ncbi:MAG: aminotransferase class I/II-fold pyridoxal phosphate-dependent enzyme, partial [Methylococcales bacterium]|nr:aminotransferase class I/II-fold pyridoxal phosphate-dependent enzyme [Methylococcales bacterium]